MTSIVPILYTLQLTMAISVKTKFDKNYFKEFFPPN